MLSDHDRKPNSYFIRTFGCQMNVHDSEHIAGVLEYSGYTPAEGIEQAEVVIFNTCSVRESAEERLWGNLSSLVRKKNGLPRVAVCGCTAQRLGVEILDRSPEVDLVFGIEAVGRLPKLLERSALGRLCDIGNVELAEIDALPSKRDSRLRAWVPVSHGCNNRCAYCVVPLVRGKEKSRTPDSIAEEVGMLASSGVVEVTLLGQNVNSYGRDLDNGCSFDRLLEMVASIPGIRRIRFETSQPRDLDDGILEVMADRPSVCEHLHLPVQSGSDRILRAMNRGYTIEYFEKRIARARKIIPGVVVTTDVIVGFPTEKEEDFRLTLELLERAECDSAYMFKYSKRQGTAAADMGDEVPERVKQGRFERLNELQEGITARSMQRLVGKVVEILVEGTARRGNLYVGRTRGNRVILLPQEGVHPDTLVLARVTEAGRHAARGVALETILDPSG